MVASQTKEQGVYIGYCVRCKGKREIKNPQKAIFRNGKPAITGLCDVCGTKMVKIVGTEKKK